MPEQSSTHPSLQNTLNMSYDFWLLHLSFASVEQDRKSVAEVHIDVVLHLAHSYMAFWTKTSYPLSLIIPTSTIKTLSEIQEDTKEKSAEGKRKGKADLTQYTKLFMH